MVLVGLVSIAGWPYWVRLAGAMTSAAYRGHTLTVRAFSLPASWAINVFGIVTIIVMGIVLVGVS